MGTLWSVDFLCGILTTPCNKRVQNKFHWMSTKYIWLLVEMGSYIDIKISIDLPLNLRYRYYGSQKLISDSLSCRLTLSLLQCFLHTILQICSILSTFLKFLSNLFTRKIFHHLARWIFFLHKRPWFWFNFF